MNFQVADWRVDVDANRIQRCDVPDSDAGRLSIKLESKVMALLVYLAEHQGSVVSREQLEAEVWSNRVISYDALTSCITRLRKVLGDDSRNPAYIETVPKKGYRLIAAVSWDDTNTTIDNSTTDDNQSSMPISIEQQKAADRKLISRVITFILLLAIVITAVIAIFFTDQSVTEVPLEQVKVPTIIVLPFDNLSDDTGQDYFSDGITTDISIALSKLSGLRVIATPSVLIGNEGSDDQRRLGLQQQTRYIVTGSVQRVGKKLRVNAVLIDSGTRHQFWAESYDREITDVFDVQDEITASIVSSLKIRLTEEEKSRVAHRYTNSIEAYDQFLRGQALYTRHTSNENMLARERFNQAIKLDPNFARAYSTLSLTYIDEYRYRWYDSTDKSLLKTLELAETAISIDDKLPQAYWSRAYALLHLRRYEQAIDTIKHVLAMKPNYADGYALLAIVYIYKGDPGNGIKMIRKAMRLNPDYPAQYTSVLGQAYYYLEDYENALTVLRDAIDKNFSLLTAHIMQIATLRKLGMYDEASWNAEQLSTISTGFKAEDIARVFPLKTNLQQQDVVEQLRSAGIR